MLTCSEFSLLTTLSRISYYNLFAGGGGDGDVNDAGCGDGGGGDGDG